VLEVSWRRRNSANFLKPRTLISATALCTIINTQKRENVPEACQKWYFALGMTQPVKRGCGQVESLQLTGDNGIMGSDIGHRLL
jgi:hypothetical protein